MKWLTKSELIFIHRRVIQETGGEAGILNESALEACLARPFATFEGRELYPTIFDKAAVLIHGIITAHPFVDGNKRVALVAVDVYLRLNGKRIRPSSEVEAFFWSIARGEQNVEQIRQWLGHHTQDVEGG
jgi:death-on-curing protein